MTCFSQAWSRERPIANKALSWITSDWQIGGVLRYASGIPFRVPASTTSLNSLIFQNTLVERVPGVHEVHLDQLALATRI